MLHGAGTTNPSKLFWELLGLVQARAKFALHATYRAVGSSTGQKEFLGASNSNKALNHFGSGDIPMTADRYNQLVCGSVRQCSIWCREILIAFERVLVFFNGLILPSDYGTHKVKKCVPLPCGIRKSRVCTDATMGMAYMGIERAAGEREPWKARAADNSGGLDHENPMNITKPCRISRFQERLSRTPFR